MSHRVALRLPCLAVAGALGLGSGRLFAQAPAQPSSRPTAEQVQQLRSAIEAEEQRLAESEKALAALKEQLRALESSVAASQPTNPDFITDYVERKAELPTTASVTQEMVAEDISDIRERQAMQASQLATLDQSKVETGSKYPLKLSGMVLVTGIASTARVDDPVAPTATFGGNGSTALSLRQTVLGFDARGPHLGAATSSADLRIDFFAIGAPASGYNSAGGLIRLRTAHASLDWPHASAFFALDRPLLSPDTPASLTAVANPALAWSGNLWNWVPQLGARFSHPVGSRAGMLFEAAWIDPADPPDSYTSTTTTSSSNPPTGAEASRKPGAEARLALFGGSDQMTGPRLGIGGYFAPHRSPSGSTFNAWAGSLDLHLPLARWFELTASAYRGQALGGLGAGSYKDYVYDANYIAHAPDDVGGWAQAAVHFNPRLSWNTAFGMDNTFVREQRGLVAPGGNSYGNVTRNRTGTTNLIWSPSAYLLFSFEYRRLTTWPISGRPWETNIYAISGGYRF